MVRVVLPVEVLKGETVSPGVIESLSNAEVVLLGYHVVPEQTPPGQARMSFEERATEALDEMVEAFEDAGVPVDDILVFTHDRDDSVTRVADEHGCDAIVYGQPSQNAQDILIPVLSADAPLGRLADTVAALVDGRDVSVDVVAYGAEADDTPAEALVDALTKRSLSERSVAYGSRATDTPVVAAGEEASKYDLVVMRNDFSLVDFVMGDKPRRIAEASLTPVVGVLTRDE